MQLPLPSIELKVITENGRRKVFDIARKKYVALTPEEHVRQALVHYLHFDRKFPLGLMKVEHAIRLNGMDRRCDLVVFGRTGDPVLVAECKSPDVPLAQQVFDQAARYNLVMKVRYLLVSNGLGMACCRMQYETEDYVFMNELPAYDDL